MKDKILLSVEDVEKRYGDYLALDKVNISVPHSSIYGLLGPNGAGKTTLMRIINQITAPDKGRVLFNNELLSKHHIKEIGYLPEERGLYKKMKVGEQALYLAQLKGMPYNEAISKLKYWFEKLEIIHWWSKKVEELSKGMAQKIQFVVTVIHNPKLLIFDEPFSGFDPINASIIRKEILSLRDNGTTIIFSTHRMESVEEICDHIALINNSKTILEGPVSQIKNDFKSKTYEIELSTNQLEFSEKFNVVSNTDNLFKIDIPADSNVRDVLNLINSKKTVRDGKIFFEGKRIDNFNEKQFEKIRGKKISIIFQEPMNSLNPSMKCGKQIEEIIIKHSVLNSDGVSKRVNELIEMVQLSDESDVREKYPFQLSGGQQQRIMIAIAIACNPKILIADEPTTSIDSVTKNEIINLLKEIQKKTKMSIIFVSHELSSF